MSRNQRIFAVLMCVSVFLAAAWWFFVMRKAPSTSKTGADYWTPILRQWAVEEGIPPEWLIATVRVESNFNPRAFNGTGGDAARGGAFGLGQMTLKTARGLGYTGDPEGLYDPRTNIHYVALLHKSNGAPGAAPVDVFARYNSGKDFANAPTVTRNDYVPRALAAFDFARGRVV